MKVKVLLFAAARDAAGTPELELELADADSTGTSAIANNNPARVGLLMVHIYKNNH
jgi:molybdopterin converting factor small subunit